MSGLIDIVAPDQPVQSQEALDAAAELQYQADLVVLAGLDRISSPSEASNPDGTKTWQVAAGRSDPDHPWLSINEFARAKMVIIAGDTMTWTNDGPGAVAHTVSGFGASPGAIPQNLSPYQPGCMTSSGELQLPPAGTVPTDIWNTCVGSEVNNFTEFSQPSAPSGDPYTDGRENLWHLASPGVPGLADRRWSPLCEQLQRDLPGGWHLPLPLRDSSRHGGNRDRHSQADAALTTMHAAPSAWHGRTTRWERKHPNGPIATSPHADAIRGHRSCAACPASDRAPESHDLGCRRRGCRHRHGGAGRVPALVRHQPSRGG